MNTLTYLLLILSIIFSTQLFGQQLSNPGIYKVNNVEYSVRHNSAYGRNIIRVRRTQQPLLKDNVYEYNNVNLDYIDIKVTNKNDYLQIIKNTLGATTLSRLKNAKEELTIDFYYTPSGKILMLSFKVKTNTMTLSDIANIDKALRENYTAKITSLQNLHLHKKWIDIGNNVIDFGKL